jgi:hypothetical protein
LPEGVYALVEATLYLATASKSNSANDYFKAYAKVEAECKVQLLGAAEAMLATNGVAWWPADRAEVERTRAALQSGLGAATYGAEWAKGRDMPVDQALASPFDDYP